jgi:hypothetical protein
MCVVPDVLATLLQLACTTCNQDLQAGIFDERFPVHLLALAAPFVVITPLVVWLSRRG